MPYDEQIHLAAEILADANYTVALTGAGISTESGIPDFRSPGTGLWEREDPEDFTIESFNADPHAFYRRIRPLLSLIEKAVPNEGHSALVEMEKMGLVRSVITQNIDGLHQMAGAKNVLEVHGTFRRGTCRSCSKKSDIKDILVFLKREEGTDCPHCGGIIKPDVTLFGEDMPPDFQLAHKEALKCDCMLVVGSSLQVAPVGFLPRYSKNLIIVNRGTTPYDELAQVVIRESTAATLKAISLKLHDMRQ
ncbi:MAG: Sir2 family NAD-dependent protein deacetylase [Bacillota bacterium]|nr:Sir2 family NAD-dependent protein deacetylase [Bacillota bacterium]MDW7683371.1 Sir2 family NAD-dependent protein deacetylase [Bacillota bacterium]